MEDAHKNSHAKLNTNIILSQIVGSSMITCNLWNKQPPLDINQFKRRGFLP